MSRFCAKKYWNSFTQRVLGRAEPAWTPPWDSAAMPSGSWSYPRLTVASSASIAIPRRSRSRGWRSPPMVIA